MEEVVSFFGKFASIRATYLFISRGDEKVFIGKKEAKIGKKKKTINLRQKRFSCTLVGAEERGSFQEGGEKKCLEFLSRRFLVQ